MMVEKALREKKLKRTPKRKPLNKSYEMIAGKRYRITFKSGSKVKVCQALYLGHFQENPQLSYRPLQGTKEIIGKDVLGFKLLENKGYTPKLPKVVN